MNKRKLVLENGQEFTGSAFGADIDKSGEVIFFTGMSGYQEMMTDPSYTGKIVIMTFPTIGAYGVNRDDFEAIAPAIDGLIVHELCENPSNFRSEENLDVYLKRYHIPGISGIDTRMLTKVIREEGMMKGIITDAATSKETVSFNDDLNDTDKLKQVSIFKPYIIPGRKKRIIVMDFGVKQSILQELTAFGCHITVVPSHYKKEAIEQFKPDGIILSNGPGNPENMTDMIETVRSLKGKHPLFGIGLGYEMIALAYGAKLKKLHTGQYGMNIPVKDVQADWCGFATMSHDYVVEEAGLPDEFEITYRSLHDGEPAGLQHVQDPSSGVQFHPEGAPGSDEMNEVLTTFLNELIPTQQINGGHHYA